jgi:predicted transposase/invertase (TIGR01784 family)
MITRLELNPAKIHQLQPKEELKIMEIYTSWELKGMEKGMEKGMQQGMQQGERLAKQEMARRLLAEGLVSIEKITELTGLTIEEIEQHD